MDEQTKTYSILPCQRQLFLDDDGIETISGLERTLHQPDKKGAVIRSPDPRGTIQTRGAPIWDPEARLFKLWVTGMENPARQSHDGLHWSPGAGPRSDLGVSMVVYDGTDPDPGRRFKAALLDRGFAVSPDGITWTQLEVPAIQSQDEGNFSFDHGEGRFIHTVKRGTDYGRSVAVATSTDFNHWDDHGVVFHTDDLDQEIGREVIARRLAHPLLKQTEFNDPEHYSIEIYNMGVFRYESLYIGLPSVYHHTGKVPPGWEGFSRMRLSPYIAECVSKYGDYTGFYNVQAACSRDLRNWTRVAGRSAFIDASLLDSGAYDLQTIIGPSDAVVRGDELWFYYTGIKQYAFITSGGEEGYDDYHPDSGAVCLAVLRRDGFVSLDAGSQEGVLETPAFALPATELWANVDARRGELRADLLDGNGVALASSAPLGGDQRAARFVWTSGHPGEMVGREVRLRFTLRDAEFYSYWFE